MENPSSPKPAPVVLTAREIEILLFALQSLREGCKIQVDYEKLLAKAGFQNTNSAQSSWAVVKKKVLEGARLASSDGVKPKTPRKTTKSKAETKSETEADIEDTNAIDKPNEVDGNIDSQMREIALREAKGQLETSNVNENREAEAKETLAVSAVAEASAAAMGHDGDSEMVDNPAPALSANKGKAKASAVDDLSGGEQSPSASTPKARKVRKKKPAKIDTAATPSDDAAGPSTATTLSETPTTPKKRGRKTNVQAEGEDDGEKPAKKARKTPAKKPAAKEQKEAKDSVVASNDDDADNELAFSAPPTPSTAAPEKKKAAAKKPATPRKPTAKALAKAAEAKRVEDEVKAALAESSEGGTEAEVTSKAGTEEDGVEEEEDDPVVVTSKGKEVAEPVVVVNEEEDTIVVGSPL